jgi:chromosome segregation ATPase
MTDIVERLREDNEGCGTRMEDAAVEIESLRQQLAECQAHAKILETGAGVSLGELAASQKLAECQAENATLTDRIVDIGSKVINLERQAIECQARETVLRDFVDVCIELDDYLTITVTDALDRVRDLPSDSTALDEAIRQAKREALLEAAAEFENLNPTAEIARCAVGDVLRRMADELKN